MHLGNGAITPECAAFTWTAASAGLGLAAWSVRRESIDPRRVAMAGALGAAVFAAQMVNVPLLPYASGHLIGGALLAWALGPGLGALTMAIVLAVQAVMLGDGGLLPLGANILNMALVPAGMVALARRTLPREASSAVRCAAAGLCGGLAVLCGAALAAGEVALMRQMDVAAFASRMLAAHAWIGLAEAGATMALAAMLARQMSASGRFSRAAIYSTAAAALVLIVVALPLASALPDGYESAAQASGGGRLLAEDGAALEAVGAANALAGKMQLRGVRACEAVLGDGQVLALIGAAAAGTLALLLAAGISRSEPAPVAIRR